MNLIEIGKKYPSSKNISGFIQLYEKYFSSLKNSKINILEIGVEGGDSLRIWREYFTNANICGIDIDSEWQSNQKWERVKSFLPNIKGMRIGDIGCSNGYYLYKLFRAL